MNSVFVWHSDNLSIVRPHQDISQGSRDVCVKRWTLSGGRLRSNDAVSHSETTSSNIFVSSDCIRRHPHIERFSSHQSWKRCVLYVWKVFPRGQLITVNILYSISRNDNEPLVTDYKTRKIDMLRRRETSGISQSRWILFWRANMLGSSWLWQSLSVLNAHAIVPKINPLCRLLTSGVYVFFLCYF